MNIKAGRRVVVVIVLVLGMAGGAWWLTRGVTVVRSALTLHGNVDIRQVALAFNGSGRIDRLLVQEGDAVKRGQLLAVLDGRRLTSAVAQAAAQVTAQQAVVARLTAGSRPEVIRRARADVAAASVEAANARRRYQRFRTLVSDHFVAKQRADDAHAAAIAARARLSAARATLALVVAGPRKEDIIAAQAVLGAARATLALRRRMLADASLYASAAGVIESRILEVGDMASPQRPVYLLALTQPLWIRTYVPEAALGKIRPGMAAEVTTDSFPGKRYRGWVGYISPTAEFTPKSVETPAVRANLVYQVRVFVCAPAGELRLGMPATVILSLTQSAASARRRVGAGCD